MSFYQYISQLQIQGRLFRPGKELNKIGILTPEVQDLKKKITEKSQNSIFGSVIGREHIT